MNEKIRFDYGFVTKISIFFWVLSVLNVMIAIIFNIPNYSNTVVLFGLPIFLNVAVLIFSLNVNKLDGLPLKLVFENKSIITYLLLASTLISVIAFPISMFFLSKGGPEIIEGQYYLVNHGEIIKEINEESYKLYTLAENLLFCDGILFFSSITTLGLCSIKEKYGLVIDVIKPKNEKLIKFVKYHRFTVALNILFAIAVIVSTILGTDALYLGIFPVMIHFIISMIISQNIIESKKVNLSNDDFKIYTFQTALNWISAIIAFFSIVLCVIFTQQ